ncbi:hypothetical protein [Labrenzia sp. 011]|uniref:hypothetical protein n=1 Tax=Labrenzia sp. 011 TaxID=2171494 RepID=UPI000D525671|nr:hypothetical protein [Labrenzia sp. 011]PVB60658.1 hypothetical protein DCO57_15810 [Labrenzia sp. 011]
MAEDERKQGLKSRTGGKPLRSLGFLSQPGTPIKTIPGEAGNGNDGPEHHRSRGSRSVSVSRDGKPEALQASPRIRPYTLEDT